MCASVRATRRWSKHLIKKLGRVLQPLVTTLDGLTAQTALKPD